eukprot:TRINITY_DN12762_c0_g1_i1.p1 TRINITY_DN12762_c0_g1~~TRINITY_DN12762_c0_g1_i1.p1  ORF type:complete len:759 (+),score=220.90 TRINITY_DN12762_c0_g1_i1:48-2279(+)
MDTVPAVGAIVEATGLVMQAELNGVKGEVVGQQEDCAVVNFDDQLKALKPKNLKLVTPAFSVGMMLQAHGLQSRLELNNLVGKVVNVQFANNSTVYTVEFPTHGVIMVKAKNARLPTDLPAADFPVGTSVEAHSLQSEVSLNGKVGVILSHQTNTGTIMVQFPAPHGTMLLKPTNLKKAQCATVDFPVGTEVEARGLQSKTSINGCTGVVAGHRQGPDATTQVIVKFPVHGTMALMPANLKKTSDASVASPQSPPAAPQPESPATMYPVNTRVTAHSLVKQTALNGVAGLVVGHQPESGQLIVQFPQPHGTHALLMKNLTQATANFTSVPSPAPSTATHDPEISKALKSIAPLPLPEVLCEGWLNKKTPAVGREYDRRWFSLRGQVLVYYEEKGRISLSASHECVQSGEGFVLTGPGMSRKFELKADKPELNEQWMAALNRAAKGGTGQNALQLLETLESAGRYQVQCHWLNEYPKISAKEYIEAMGKGTVVHQNGVGGGEEADRVREEMVGMQRKYEEEKVSLQDMVSRLNSEMEEVKRQLEEARQQTDVPEAVNTEEEKQALEMEINKARSEASVLKEQIGRVEAEKAGMGSELEKLREEMRALEEKFRQQEEVVAQQKKQVGDLEAALAAKPVHQEVVGKPAEHHYAAPTPQPVVAEPDPVPELEPESTQEEPELPQFPVPVEDAPAPEPVAVSEPAPVVPAEPEPELEPAQPEPTQPEPTPAPAPAVTIDGSSAFLLAD